MQAIQSKKAHFLILIKRWLKNRRLGKLGLTSDTLSEVLEAMQEKCELLDSIRKEYEQRLITIEKNKFRYPVEVYEKGKNEHIEIIKMVNHRVEKLRGAYMRWSTLL